MPIRTSYLQKPRRDIDSEQARLRSRMMALGNPDNSSVEQTSAGNASLRTSAAIPRSGPRPSNGRAAVRFVYRWAVRAVLVGSLVLLGSLILFMWAPKAHPGTAKELQPLPHMTAMTAYDIARPATLRWAKDSQLLSLTGTWDSGRNYLDGEGAWSLMFYSPSHSSIALVSVTEGGAAIVDTHRITQQPQLHAAENWLLDSPEVINLLRSNGGEEFLRSKPHAGLALSLNLVGEATWSARLINQESRRILQVRLEADDGEITDIRQSG